MGKSAAERMLRRHSRSVRERYSSGGRRCTGSPSAARKGVRQVLDILRDEVENALALLGCRSPAEVTRAHVTRA